MNSAARIHDYEPPADELDDDGHDDWTPEALGLAPEPVEVRRNGGLAALVGSLASAVAIAYLARAAGTGSSVDWALFAVMAALGVGHLLAFVDARTPLLVADVQGVRIRLGRTWRGIPWGAVEYVEHQPRRGVLRDGRLTLVTRDADQVLDGLDRSGRRQVALADRLYGSPLALPLAMSTRVAGAGDDLTGALERLAGDPDLVVEVTGPGPDEPDDAPDVDEHGAPELDGLGEDDGSARPHLHDPRPALARAIDFLAAARRRVPAEPPAADPVLDPVFDPVLDPGPATEHGNRAAADAEREERPEPADMPPVVASATPSPLREPVSGTRADIRFDTQGAAALAPTRDEDDSTRPELPEARELRRPGSVNLVEEAIVWSDRVRPIARAGDPVAPLVIDDFAVEPAEDPVIGPEVSAARTRLSLTVDQLAERTRIRPHVIESIEVDDFAPCGGDFYARGHLRTLARVLGIDAAPLLATYDERYADAPIDARRVFEAELATGAGGPIRSARGGPNWSVLVAAVMAVVLAWSIARLLTDSPVHLQARPVLNGSPVSAAKLGPPVPVVLDAAKGGAHVVVRNGAGDVVLNGDLSFGESTTLRVSPPVRVQSSDGSLRITIDGKDRGPLGATGQPAQNTFTVED